MTEHLALEQTLRDTAEIDFHKRLSGALTVDMDSFGYQFLTCTTLAGNEYGSVGTGYAGYGIQHLHQSLRFSDDVTAVQTLRLLFRHFFRSGTQFQGGFDTLQKGGIVPRFGNKVKSPRLHPLYGKLDASPCRHQYNGNIGTEDLYLFQQRKPLLSGSGKCKVHIHQYQCGRFCTNYIHRLTGSRCCFYLITGTLQHKTK